MVRSGDTLWSIAEQQMGAPGNVADQVQRIRQINQLEGSSLVPGDVLYVPLE
ncbi:MAG: LysM peptidoglycan-binding domain-containing protein [Bifidobacteriaceae bacterium]|nr:LysM peptidoglycan-binding domain-containing protein [Bifidobacteriaceae bacterium]